MPAARCGSSLGPRSNYSEADSRRKQLDLDLVTAVSRHGTGDCSKDDEGHDEGNDRHHDLGRDERHRLPLPIRSVWMQWAPFAKALPWTEENCIFRERKKGRFVYDGGRNAHHVWSPVESV